MGWSRGEVNGRIVGYSVDGVCEHPDCENLIGLGLRHACGGFHGEGENDKGEWACDKYFCDEHLSGLSSQLCEGCHDNNHKVSEAS